MRSIFNALTTILLTLFWAGLGIVTWPLSPSGRLTLIYARIWSWMVLKVCGVKLTVTGREGIDWGRPYIFMSNHQTHFDILALFAAIPAPVRMLSKKQLRAIPIFGWSMWMARFIFIDRSNQEKAFRSIELAAERVARGHSIVVFPEGTRTKEGYLGPFKKGGFVLAIKSQVPILPIGIVGSGKVLRRHTLTIRPGPIRVHIGRPIETGPFDEENKEELMTEVRRSIEGLMHMSDI